MPCIIVLNRRTASPEFFSWVHVRRLLSRHTNNCSCPVRSPRKLSFSIILTKVETKELLMTRENVRILSAEPFQFAPLFHSYGLSAHTLIKA
ncbi:unnamed protein product [Porites evermanni]|uniref:Uncharacterized protein n=1 Tax=Porites evermanni TaxID=104178 RepID=A0ABN8S2H6_9CNID|nr:unnamed protein product [Porites evermanni]